MDDWCAHAVGIGARWEKYDAEPSTADLLRGSGDQVRNGVAGSGDGGTGKIQATQRGGR